jgi:hypothetical protein
MMKARKGFAMVNRKNCIDKMATARLRINRGSPTAAQPALCAPLAAARHVPRLPVAFALRFAA